MDFDRILDLNNFPRGCFILGPRQVGKTYLVNKYIESLDSQKYFTIILNFKQRITKLNYERNPSLLKEELNAAIKKNETKKIVLFLDEIQELPEILNDLQVILDDKLYKNKMLVFITGSSARKLKRKNTNLLPGRIDNAYLHPLTIFEWENKYVLDDIFQHGSLPGILISENKDATLESYVDIYLREEIEAEAIARDLGAFGNFLTLAAEESGLTVSYSTIARDIGISAPTVKSFYQILEDTLIVKRLDPFLKSPRKRLFTGPKYYFFDIGVLKRLCLLKKPELGRIFENWLVNEVSARLNYTKIKHKLYYWRTHQGNEVDLIIEHEKKGFIAIEIKSSTSFHPKNLKGLSSFLFDHNVDQTLIVGPFDRARLFEIKNAKIEIMPYREFLDWL